MNGMANAENAESSERHNTVCWIQKLLPSQSSFLRLTNRFKGFSGPVGSGKSAALCLEVVRQSYRNRRRHGVLAAPTLTMLRDATLTSLHALLGEQDIEYESRKADGELTFIAAQSRILLRSLDEPERLRGTNLAWFGVDELSYAREEAWLRLEARLRDPKAEKLCGFGVWTPQGHDWIYKRFIHEPISGHGCIRARAFENRFLLDKTPDYYRWLERSYDPKFYQQEVLGDYLNSRADRVYHCFNVAANIQNVVYDPNKPLIWSLDFNVSPMSSIVLQRDEESIEVIDEIVLDRATTAEACIEFENRFRSHNGLLEICGDASGRNMHTTGTNDYNTVQNSLYRAGFRKITLKVPSKNPSVMERVHRVNSMLSNALGEVRIHIHPKCRELIKDFEQVLFKPDSGVIDKTRDAKRTHASDALGYAVWELFGTKPTAGERGIRLI